VQPAEQLRIDTPEQIALELSVAGIGSRFLAIAVDTVLQLFLYIAGFVAFVAFQLPAALLPSMGLFGPALAILFTFCVYWGYFAFFEILWSGRTPGKRLAGIRVIKDTGRPINAFEAIGRNVLRAIDFLPAMYAIGIVCMMLNRNSRRLGDFVAGTIVVHDKQTEDVRPDWNTDRETSMGGWTSSRSSAATWRIKSSDGSARRPVSVLNLARTWTTFSKRWPNKFAIRRASDDRARAARVEMARKRSVRR